MFVCTSRELWHAVRPSSRRSHSGGGQAIRCRGPVCVQHVYPGDRWHQVRHGTGYSHFQFVMHWHSYSYTPRPPSHSIIVTSSLRAVNSHLSSSLPSPALPSFWGEIISCWLWKKILCLWHFLCCCCCCLWVAFQVSLLRNILHIIGLMGLSRDSKGQEFL